MSGRPPRVLVCARPGTGGAARVIEALLRLLAERGVGGTAALSSQEGEFLLDAAHDHGWDVVQLDMRREISPVRDAHAGLRLRRIARGHDLVHAHAAKAGALARLALPLRKGVPVIYAPHGFYFTYHAEGSAAWRRYLGLEQRLAPRTVLLHCVSETERDLAVGHGLATPENCCVLRNPIAPAAPRCTDGHAFDGPVVLMVARLVPPKDPVTFVRAAALVPPELGARFVLVGEGELGGPARAADAHGHVTFLPRETDVHALLGRAAVAVLASDSEALPLYLLEALSAGAPVVASDLRGCREAAGEAGRYVPLRDPAALAAAISEVLRDEPLRRRMRAAAKELTAASEETTWIADVLAMYERVR